MASFTSTTHATWVESTDSGAHNKHFLNNWNSETETRGNVMLDKVQLAYTAGVLDGEGSISLSKSKTRFWQGRGYFYSPRVTIVNTDLNLIKRLKSWFGGVILERKMLKNHLGKKTIYVWNLNGQPELRLFLKSILPFLAVKRKQAELLIEYLDGAASFYGKARNRMGLPITEWDRRDHMFKRLKELNHDPHRLSESAEASVSEAIVEYTMNTEMVS